MKAVCVTQPDGEYFRLTIDVEAFTPTFIVKDAASLVRRRVGAVAPTVCDSSVFLLRAMIHCPDDAVRPYVIPRCFAMRRRRTRSCASRRGRGCGATWATFSFRATARWAARRRAATASSASAPSTTTARSAASLFSCLLSLVSFLFSLFSFLLSAFCFLLSAFCFLLSAFFFCAFCVLCSVFCVLFSAFCFLLSAFYFLCSASCVLCSVFCVLFSVFLCSLFSVRCSLFSFLCPLSSSLFSPLLFLNAPSACRASSCPFRPDDELLFGIGGAGAAAPQRRLVLGR
eukprot:SAG11_NODE_974_length_6334_cov_29.611387_7_plen_286_part_00